MALTEQVYTAKRLTLGSYRVVKVPLERIESVWGHAYPLLQRGMGAAPELRMDAVIDGLMDESIQLWLVTDGAAIVAVFLTSIERDHGEWVISLYAMGGAEPQRWLHECDITMEHFARVEDARRIRMCGRKAWRRLLPPSFSITGERGGHSVYERAVDGGSPL